MAVPSQGQELYSVGQVSHFAGYFHMRGNWLVERGFGVRIGLNVNFSSVIHLCEFKQVTKTSLGVGFLILNIVTIVSRLQNSEEIMKKYL